MSSIIVNTYNNVLNLTGEDRTNVLLGLTSDLVASATDAQKSSIARMVQTITATSSDYNNSAVIEAIDKITVDEVLPEVYVIPHGSNTSVSVTIPSGHSYIGFARAYETELNTAISPLVSLGDFTREDGSVAFDIPVYDLDLTENQTFKVQILIEDGTPAENLVKEVWVVVQETIDYGESTSSRFKNLDLEYTADGNLLSLSDGETLLDQVTLTDNLINLVITEDANGIVEIIEPDDFVVPDDIDAYLYEVQSSSATFSSLLELINTVDSDLRGLIESEKTARVNNFTVTNSNYDILSSSVIENSTSITTNSENHTILVSERIDPLDGPNGRISVAEGLISVNSDNIELKVSKDNIITALNIALGEITVEADVFKSSNFVGGSSGWALFESGSTEFNDVVLRGDLISGEGDVIIDEDGLNLSPYSFAVTAGNPVNIPESQKISWGSAVSLSGGSDDAFLNELTIIADTISAGGATLQVAAVQALGVSVLDNIDFSGLPTSSSGLPAGRAWNNSGVLNIV